MADQKISSLPSASVPLTGSEVLPIVQSGVTKKVDVSGLTYQRSVSAAKIGLGVASPTLRCEIVGEAPYPTLGTASGGFKLTSNSELYGLFGGVNGSNGNSWLQAMRTDSATAYDIVLNPSGGNIQTGAGNLVQGTAAKGINFTANTPAAGMTSQLLNYYEEGTWTPTVTGSVSNPTLTIDATYTGGKYTRIGRIVYITFEVRWSAVSGGSGDVVITGLPFTRNSTTQPSSDFFPANSRGVTYSGDTLVCMIANGSTSMTFSSNDPAGGAQYTLSVSGLGVSSIGFLRGSGSYMV